MRMLRKIIRLKLTDAGYTTRYFWAVSFILLATLGSNAQAQQNKETNQEKSQAKQELKNMPFVDEDGDGFNDLLPDSDGDGIPDMIDPDFKGHSAESLYMHRYMYGQTIEDERNRYQNMMQHGEDGQYGPMDSTGHGMHDGQGGGHHGGSGNQGGQGGHDGEGGNGGGPGLNAPETKDNSAAAAKANPANSEHRAVNPGTTDKNQTSGAENPKGGNQGEQGGGRP